MYDDIISCCSDARNGTGCIISYNALWNEDDKFSLDNFRRCIQTCRNKLRSKSKPEKNEYLLSQYQKGTKLEHAGGEVVENTWYLEGNFFFHSH